MADWKEPLKLELGAGEHPSSGGYVHNDVLPYPHVEIVADCRSLPMIETGGVTIIRAIHLLEHFGPKDALDALREWLRCLCPCGVLEVALPDLQHLALMTLLGNITQAAFLRDLYGLFPAPDWLTPERVRETVRSMTRGMAEGAGTSRQGQTWASELAVLYAPTWQGEEMAQAHKWGYCEASLRWHLEEAGLRNVVVERDGTSLHGWGEK